MDNIQITYKDVLQWYGEAMLEETGEEIALFACSFEDYKIVHDSRDGTTRVTMYDFRVMHEPGTDVVTIINNGGKWLLHDMQSWAETGYTLK